MLKTGPATLKHKDRLSALLSRLPGVELASFGPDEVRRIGSVVVWTRDLQPSQTLPVEFPPEEHPVAAVLSNDLEGPGYERPFTDCIETLRSLLAGKEAREFYPLPLPDPSFGPISRHVRIDGFPVRVIRSYSQQHQGYLTSFDAYRPRAIAE